MPGPAIHGTADMAAGVPAYYSDDQLRLYSRFNGYEQAAYLSGWHAYTASPAIKMLDGPTRRAMTWIGTGSEPILETVSAMNNTPCLTTWDGSKRIDTGFQSTHEFTLLAQVYITSTQESGTGTSNRLFYRGGDQDTSLLVTGTGNIHFQLSGSVPVFISNSAYAYGPHVLMATAREVSTNVSAIKLFVDDLATPVAYNDSVSLTLGAVANWHIGAATASNTTWKGGIRSFRIINKDLTANAYDWAAIADIGKDLKAIITP